jgi:hypothetical protein
MLIYACDMLTHATTQYCHGDPRTTRPFVARASCPRFFSQSLSAKLVGKSPALHCAGITFLIATPIQLKIAATRTKQSSRPLSNRYRTGCSRNAPPSRPFVARASCPRLFGESPSTKLIGKSPALRSFGIAFLIGTPKRLEIAVTQSKQSPRPISNRYKIRGSKSAPGGGSCCAEPGSVRHGFLPALPPENRPTLSGTEACGTLYRPRIHL